MPASQLEFVKEHIQEILDTSQDPVGKLEAILALRSEFSSQNGHSEDVPATRFFTTLEYLELIEQKGSSQRHADSDLESRCATGPLPSHLRSHDRVVGTFLANLENLGYTADGWTHFPEEKRRIKKKTIREAAGLTGSTGRQQYVKIAREQGLDSFVIGRGPHPIEVSPNELIRFGQGLYNTPPRLNGGQSHSGTIASGNGSNGSINDELYRLGQALGISDDQLQVYKERLATKKEPTSLPPHPVPNSQPTKPTAEIAPYLWNPSNPYRIVGRTTQIEELEQRIRRISHSPLPVLIVGETGVGKELVARAIHQQVGPSKPFVSVNCGSLAESLIEAEFFGNEKGAYTGATGSRTGLLKRADGGTLFLDEVGTLSLKGQTTLLRALQESEFIPVGGNSPISSHYRLICATNIDLSSALENKTLRPDFFYRINKIRLEVDPLRNRKADIPHLARYFLDKHGAANLTLPPEAMETLGSYDWPGNVRQLETVMQLCVVYADDTITSHHVEDCIKQAEIPLTYDSIDAFVSKGLHLGVTPDLYEEKLIHHAMEQAGGNQTRAAALVGLSRDQLRYRLRNGNGVK